MIDAFKTLSFEVTDILYEKRIEELSKPFQAMPRNLRKIQTEEWIAMNQVDKAHKIYINVSFGKFCCESSLEAFVFRNYKKVKLIPPG